MPDLDQLRDLRNALIADAGLIAVVPATSIKTGWEQEFKTFPCIVITQSGGYAVGLTGVANGAAGNRVAKERVSFQINIYSSVSRRQTLEICGLLSNVMLVLGYEKTTDRNEYSTELNAYYKITGWKTNSVFNF